MRITIDIQSEDIKEALEAHIKNQLNIDASVDVDWLDGRYGVTVSLGDAPAYISDVADTDKSVTKPEPVKRTRRSKEQIEADRLAEASVAIDVQAEEEGFGTRTVDVSPGVFTSTKPVPEQYYEPTEKEPTAALETAFEELRNGETETFADTSGLMATIFAEEPEVEEVVQDIFAVEDNSVFAQPVTENVFAIK